MKSKRNLYSNVLVFSFLKMKKIKSVYAGKERRLNYTAFRKMYKDLNSHLTGKALECAAEQAFIDADCNQDRWISFDEFVNAYSNFKATKCLLPFNRNGLFQPLSCIDQSPYLKMRPSWRIVNLINQTKVYYSDFCRL